MNEKDMVRLVLRNVDSQGLQGEIVHTVACGDTLTIAIPAFFNGKRSQVEIAKLEIIDIIRSDV